MKRLTEILLTSAWRYCDVEDKSDAFMLEYMQSAANVGLDTVLSFIEKHDSWIDLWTSDDEMKKKIELEISLLRDKRAKDGWSQRDANIHLNLIEFLEQLNH